MVFTKGCMGSSRALEADLAAAAGQLRACALPGDGASDGAGPAAGLGCRDGVQAVWQHIQHRLGSLRGPRDDSPLLQQLRACTSKQKPFNPSQGLGLVCSTKDFCLLHRPCHEMMDYVRHPCARLTSVFGGQFLLASQCACNCICSGGCLLSSSAGEACSAPMTGPELGPPYDPPT